MSMILKTISVSLAQNLVSNVSRLLLPAQFAIIDTMLMTTLLVQNALLVATLAIQQIHAPSVMLKIILKCKIVLVSVK